jgi:energy-coupling factor transporter transmembrane protein EcfT
MDRLINGQQESGPVARRPIDARVKLLFVAVVTMAAARTETQGLALASMAVIGVVIRARADQPDLYRGLLPPPFFLLLMAIVTAHAFFTPGEPLVAGWGMAITREGLTAGGMTCWRLVLILVAGTVVAAATPPDQIRAAFYWILQPVLPKRASRVATLLVLMLRFMVTLRSRVGVVALAQKARGVERRKNPFYRMRIFALPLLVAGLAAADRLALAMAARCYTDDRTGPAIAFGRRDTAATAAVLVLAAAVFIV